MGKIEPFYHVNDIQTIHVIVNREQNCETALITEASVMGRVSLEIPFMAVFELVNAFQKIAECLRKIAECLRKIGGCFQK